MDDEFLNRARKRALYVLARRAYSRYELKQKLLKDYRENICDKVLEYVGECGYIDDEVYAKNLAEELINVKFCGIRKARWDMRGKGLDDDLTESVLAEYSELDKISELLNQKYQAKLSNPDDIRRTISALQRRGYEYGNIISCIKKLENKD